MAKTLRVVLNVSQFDEVVTFYRDLLGLPLVGDWNAVPAIAAPSFKRPRVV